MSIQIRKVADILGNVVVGSGRYAGDAAAILTGQQPVSEPASGRGWQLELIIGEGTGTRRVLIDLPPLLGKKCGANVPALLGEGQMGQALYYFRSKLFLADRLPRSRDEREEVALRIKKAIYNEEAELASLRASVANLEAAIEYQRTGSKRAAIPEDVKLVVWARDGGACVRCGSKAELHFDHIIPVAKGGGNTAANIQVLCQTCNLKKSDKIAVP